MTVALSQGKYATTTTPIIPYRINLIHLSPAHCHPCLLHSRVAITIKSGFHYPSWRVPGFHYPSTRAVLAGARFFLSMHFYLLLSSSKLHSCRSHRDLLTFVTFSCLSWIFQPFFVPSGYKVTDHSRFQVYADYNVSSPNGPTSVTVRATRTSPIKFVTVTSSSCSVGSPFLSFRSFADD